MSYQAPMSSFAVGQAAARQPVLRRNRAERVFDLHPALHVALFGGFAAFLGILAAGLMTRELIIPMAICFLFVAAAFATPALWARVAGERQGRTQTLGEFMEEGIDIATGHLGGGAAVAQVLILPVLLIGWALVIVTIKALV